MAKKKIVLTVKSRGYERGAEVEVEADRAEAMIRDGVARAAKPAPAAKKAD